MGELNIYNKLMKEFKNIYGVCGLMGNLKAESNLDSRNMQNSCMTKLGMTDEQYIAAVDNGTYKDFCIDRVGTGLAQHTTSGRKTGLYNYAKATGRSIGDEDMQLEWIIHELKTAYKSVYNTLKNATSVKEASDIVVLKYEKPASVLSSSTEARRQKTLDTREALGMEIYNKYHGNDKKDDDKGEISVGKLICIDAGHSMVTAGKRCMKAIDPNETREWVLNSRIANRLQELLTGYDCRTMRVDDVTGKVDYSEKQRVAAANNAKADFYMSIHHNAGLAGRKGGGTVVYYYSSNPERARQSQSLYNEVVSRTGLSGNRSSKVIKKGFYVIKYTSMPAALIENGFMDSWEDVPVILSEEHAEKTAQGILAFLVKEFDLKRNGNTIPNANTSQSIPLKPEPTRNYLMRGDKGDDVLELQKNLYEIGFDCGKPDGIFGKETEQSVKEFQKAYKLTVDGKYGAASKKAMEKALAAAKEKESGKQSDTVTSQTTYTRTQFIKDVQKAIGAKADGMVGQETLSKVVTVSKSKNNKHAVVKPLQKYLNALGYSCGTVDGVAGVKFDTATKAWQKANGCTADGEFTKGGKSWRCIFGLK